MITIPRSPVGPGQPMPAGTWQPATFEGQRTATLACPSGHLGLLNHEISETGVVSPSVVCPDGSCDWHEHVKLDGWASAAGY